MATNFGQNWQNDLHSALWHFKTDWNIAIWIGSFIAAMIPLHCVQIGCGELWFSNAEVEVEEFVLLKRYCKNRTISLNISTTTEPIFTNVSALVEVCMWIIKLT